MLRLSFPTGKLSVQLFCIRVIFRRIARLICVQSIMR